MNCGAALPRGMDRVGAGRSEGRIDGESDAMSERGEGGNELPHSMWWSGRSGAELCEIGRVKPRREKRRQAAAVEMVGWTSWWGWGKAVN